MRMKTKGIKNRGAQVHHDKSKYNREIDKIITKLIIDQGLEAPEGTINPDPDEVLEDDFMRSHQALHKIYSEIPDVKEIKCAGWGSIDDGADKWSVKFYEGKRYCVSCAHESSLA